MGDVVLAVDFGTSFTSAAIVADGVVQPSTIDDLYFRDRIRRLYARIAEVLRRHSGVLMGSEPITPASAEEALGRLSNLLRSG
jgi:molecular chaperone DnaK (HSP70)